MKKMNLILAASAMLMLVGCAGNKASTYPKYSYMEKLESSASIIGGHKVEILAPVAWNTNQKCSVVDFVTFATSNNNQAHDVINIRADETKIPRGGGMDFDYSCKYWGLAVRLVPVDAPAGEPKIKGKMTFTVNEAEVE